MKTAISRLYLKEKRVEFLPRRSRYLALLVTGENHPELALIDSNIGLILHAVGEYDISLRFLEKALSLNLAYHGPKSLKVAVSYHLVARTQSCMGDFR